MSSTRRLAALEFQRKAQQGQGRPIFSWRVGEIRYVAVGGKVLSSGNWGTFHDFLVDYVVEVFGLIWFQVELSKVDNDRHPVVVWQQNVFKLNKVLFRGGENYAMAEATGAIAAYLNFAYNLYLVSHNAKAQKRLVERLKNIDQFYGAYYELFVAAQFIKSGFVVDYENEADVSRSHVEFVATHEKSGKKYSVEAKSRRAGDASDVSDNVDFKLCAKIRCKLFDALKKDAKYKRIVFVDANFYDNKSKPRNKEILKLLSSGLRKIEPDAITNGNPSPEAYLIITNYPYHYELDSVSYNCSAIAVGFKIPEFNFDSKFSSLLGALEARSKHREMFDLIECMSNQEVPATFDGESPEFAFEEGGLKRLLIGGRYFVPDEFGNDVIVQIESGCVNTNDMTAVCSCLADDGRRVIVSFPLSKREVQAYHRHPETFFGEIGHVAQSARDGLDFFDFMIGTYGATPKEKLLEFLASWPDIADLKTLPQKELAQIYCLRLTEQEYYNRSK